MTRVAILIPSITKGDALGNDVTGMRRALQACGHEAAGFADWIISDPEFKHVSELKHFLRDDTDVVIYHHAVGWDAGIEILTRIECKRVIKYHNVTPARFFDGISALYAGSCRTGREQLRILARAGCDLYLADSEFNMQELILEGVNGSASSVVPPFHHIDRLATLEPDQSVLNSYRDGKINILTVGRIVPNKGHRLLIDAFAIYHRYCNRDSRLLIVGEQDHRLSAYRDMLREQVTRLELDEAVVFSGRVSDRALGTYYNVADVFMITSEHEGFCVPLVEAMAMQVPIVAYGSTAIPGTVGEAGLVWNDRDPELMAESIDHIVSNRAIRQGLGLKGLRRYQQLFANERIEARFLNALDRVLTRPE